MQPTSVAYLRRQTTLWNENRLALCAYCQRRVVWGGGLTQVLIDFVLNEGKTPPILWRSHRLPVTEVELRAVEREPLTKPSYDPCPDCGGEKSKLATRCRICHSSIARGKNVSR